MNLRKIIGLPLLALFLISLLCGAPLPGISAAGPALFLPLVARSQSGPTLGGCPLFPVDNIWNTSIDSLPAAQNSSAYINSIGPNVGLHPDFGSGIWPDPGGFPIGIPYTLIPGSQPKVAITFDYDTESDPGPYPIPPDVLIEGNPNSGDRHILLLDQDNCLLYEVWNARKLDSAGLNWAGGSGAIFDLRSNLLRPDTWTSADAAGLPVLPGLVRYDEVASGEIRHALRFTIQETRKAYVWPARHYASDLTGPQYPPMGQRFRLKAGFNLSSFSPPARIILTAMQKYGLILADNGSNWYISGVPDERWDNDILRELGRVHGSDFEAVDATVLMISPDSGQALQP